MYRTSFNLRGPQRLDILVRRATLLRESKTRVLHFGPASTTYPAGPRALVCLPTFAKPFERASEIVESSLGWSPWKTMHDDMTPAEISDFENYLVRECLYQLALFDAHRQGGLRYEYVLATSIGEVAAAHAAGVTTFEEAVRVCCSVARALRASEPGDLVLISAPPNIVRGLLSAMGRRDLLRH